MSHVPPANNIHNMCMSLNSSGAMSSSGACSIVDLLQLPLIDGDPSSTRRSGLLQPSRKLAWLHLLSGAPGGWLHVDRVQDTRGLSQPHHHLCEQLRMHWRQRAVCGRSKSVASAEHYTSRAVRMVSTTRPLCVGCTSGVHMLRVAFGLGAKTTGPVLYASSKRKFWAVEEAASHGHPTATANPREEAEQI